MSISLGSKFLKKPEMLSCCRQGGCLLLHFCFPVSLAGSLQGGGGGGGQGSFFGGRDGDFWGGHFWAGSGRGGSGMRFFR